LRQTGEVSEVLPDGNLSEMFNQMVTFLTKPELSRPAYTASEFRWNYCPSKLMRTALRIGQTQCPKKEMIAERDGQGRNHHLCR
jgi:hypothetical protein